MLNNITEESTRYYLGQLVEKGEFAPFTLISFKEVKRERDEETGDVLSLLFEFNGIAQFSNIVERGFILYDVQTGIPLLNNDAPYEFDRVRIFHSSDIFYRPEEAEGGMLGNLVYSDEWPS